MPLHSSIADVAKAFRQRRLSIVDQVDECLTRIDCLDSTIRAWTLVDTIGARRAAQELDRELAAGIDRGPLHGIPLGIKDLIDVRGLPTRAGSPLREQCIAGSDAAVVARLKAAGAIILGKTVTCQFGGFDPSPTRNPWNIQCTPGGSSSGSAAAVATGMCLAAVGTQTGGSLTRPASYCGVAACKPTFGRVSRTGVVLVSERLDHVGPIARTVSDLAALLDAMADGDVNTRAENRRESVTQPARRDPPRLGFLAGFFETHCDAVMSCATASAIDKLRVAGAMITPLKLPSIFADVLHHHRVLMSFEAAEQHREMFARHRDQYAPRMQALLDEGLAHSQQEYEAAVRHQKAFRSAMRPCFEDVDALVTAATPTTAPRSHETTGDPAFNSPWSYAGLPTVSIPCAIAEDVMPTALQFIGPELGEARLFEVAAWCETQVDFHHVAPLLDSV